MLNLRTSMDQQEENTSKTILVADGLSIDDQTGYSRKVSI
ncbi:hypothetical protein BVRB_9g221930 [Beta vulgaris subsp. vulgaris]|nr:hypothetical protein BVRB_9g221930 [Beta vulgaris subsp. vulgaris]